MHFQLIIKLAFLYNKKIQSFISSQLKSNLVSLWPFSQSQYINSQYQMGNSQPTLNYFENKILVASINYGGYLENPFQFYSSSEPLNSNLKSLSKIFQSLIPQLFPKDRKLTPQQQQKFDFGFSRIDETILRERYSPVLNWKAGTQNKKDRWGLFLKTKKDFDQAWQNKYKQIPKKHKNNQNKGKQINQGLKKQNHNENKGEQSIQGNEDKQKKIEQDKVSLSQQQQRLKNFDYLCYQTIVKFTNPKINIQTIDSVSADEYIELMKKIFDRTERLNQKKRIENIIEILSQDFNDLMKLKQQQKSSIPKLIDVLFIQNPTNQLVQALQKGQRKRKYYIVGKNDLSKCLIVARRSSFHFFSTGEVNKGETSQQKKKHDDYVHELVLPNVRQLLNKTKSNLLVCDGYAFLGVNFKKAEQNQASEKPNSDKPDKASHKQQEPQKQKDQANTGQSLNSNLLSNIIAVKNSQNGPTDKKEGQNISNDNKKPQTETQKKISTQKENSKVRSDIDILKSTLQKFKHFKRQIVIVVGGYIDSMIQPKENPLNYQQINHYDIYPKYQIFTTSNYTRTSMHLQFQKKANVYEKACKSQIMSSCQMPKRARMNIDATAVNQSFLIPNSKHPFPQYLIVSLIKNQVKQHQKKILKKRHYLTKYHNTRRKLQGRQSESGFSQKLSVEEFN